MPPVQGRIPWKSATAQFSAYGLRYHPNQYDFGTFLHKLQIAATALADTGGDLAGPPPTDDGGRAIPLAATIDDDNLANQGPPVSAGPAPKPKSPPATEATETATAAQGSAAAGHPHSCAGGKAGCAQAAVSPASRNARSGNAAHADGPRRSPFHG